MTVVLGTLWCSIKPIQAPYVFEWEHGIALQQMLGIRASSPTQGDISRDFSSCGKNLGYILELQWGWPFETPLEVLVESWLKSSIKDRESALNLGRYGMHGAFLELLY